MVKELLRGKGYFLAMGFMVEVWLEQTAHTLSSSTIQLPVSSSLPSWNPSSFTIWFTEICVKPVACANCSACVVFPTPGVPVMTMFGFWRAMLEEGEVLVGSSQSVLRSLESAL